MRTPVSPSSATTKDPTAPASSRPKYPSALEIATHAVELLEDDPLFNAGKGAVFTRDGINELEASVMVSRPSTHAKRGVGVTGLRRVRNPIRLARAVLEHGDEDLGATTTTGSPYRVQGGCSNTVAGEQEEGHALDGDLDVPSAQGHTLIHGPTAEILARKYGLELVDPRYFFTQKRWDEHVRALSRASSQRTSFARATAATWSPDEYLPQGTVGAVALGRDGVLCAATSTGGMTNKLTGRIGDTPVVGAGFWAEEWEEQQQQQQQPGVAWQDARAYLAALPGAGPAVELGGALHAFLADCLPTPFLYAAVAQQPRLLRRPHSISAADAAKAVIRTRATAVSGTGNGDSFLRTAAARTVGGVARWTGVRGAEAVARVAGPGGELQRSAGDRWGRTNEGEGGMIGIEVVAEREAGTGRLLGGPAGVVLHDHNSAGMFRAWIDDDGVARFKIWRDYDE